MSGARRAAGAAGRRGLLAVAAALACAVVAGVAYAAIPGGDGRIDACIKKSGGAVRVIDAEAGAQCASSETPLSWSRQGPPGPPGPQGPAGADGAFSGWEVVRVPATFPPGYQDAVAAMCPAGKKPLGGGWFPVDNQGLLNVLGSFPADPAGGSGGPITNPSDFQGWALYANNPHLDRGTATAIVYAVCATVQ